MSTGTLLGREGGVGEGSILTVAIAGDVAEGCLVGTTDAQLACGLGEAIVCVVIGALFTHEASRDTRASRLKYCFDFLMCFWNEKIFWDGICNTPFHQDTAIF